MDSSQQSLGSFLFQYLYDKGVKTAFGIPGDFALPTFKWLAASPIKLINMTHEPSVGFAADGYARMNGIGLAVVTYCVGGLNMLNSIACAYAEKSPVIVVSGGPSPKDLARDPMIHHKVKTFDSQRKIYEEVTCANTVLSDPETAAAEIMRVVDAVLENCRPGYIEVPFDMVDKMVSLPSLPAPRKPSSDQESLAALLEEVVLMLNNAAQPVIMADIELHRHRLTHLALEIAEKFNIPIASTLLSKSVISEDHPLYIGSYSGTLTEEVCKEYVEGSDCILMLGAFLSDVLQGFSADYTRLERKNSIMITMKEARVGYRYYQDVRFEDFLRGLAVAGVKKRSDFENPTRRDPVIPLSASELAKSLDASSIFRVLSLSGGANASFVCDTGDALFGAIDIRTRDSQSFISDAYYLSMGFGVPAAIGVMAANPERRAFILVGDGAFQMTGMELSTALRFSMAPIVIIFNNAGYGTQRFILDGEFNNILNWNYTKITEVFGQGRAMRATTCGEFQQAVEQALREKELCIIEAVIPQDACSRALRSVGEGLRKLRL